METKYISFYSSKGGVGKTMLNSIVAYYLLKTEKLNIAVVDVDTPQYTLFRRREQEHSFLQKEIAGQEKTEIIELDQDSTLFSSGCEYTYDLFKCKPQKIPQLHQLLESKNYDLVFFDITGSLNVEGIAEVFKQTEYFFIPTSTDTEEIDSAVRIYQTLKRIKGGDEKIRILFNRVKKVSSTKIISFQNTLERANFQFLNTKIHDYEIFREDYRSSIKMPLKRDVKNNNIYLLMAEIKEIINL